jgi:thioredoxin 1
MKHLFLCGLFAGLVAGCAEPVDTPTAETSTEPATADTADHAHDDAAHDDMAHDDAAHSDDHSQLVSEVDADGLTKTLAENSVTLIDFTATWCGPCQKLKPALHELAEEFEGKAKFVEVDVDKSQDLAAKYEVEGMPTLIVLKGDEIQKRFLGFQPGETIEELKTALEAAQ